MRVRVRRFRFDCENKEILESQKIYHDRWKALQLMFKLRAMIDGGCHMGCSIYGYVFLVISENSVASFTCSLRDFFEKDL